MRTTIAGTIIVGSMLLASCGEGSETVGPESDPEETAMEAYSGGDEAEKITQPNPTPTKAQIYTGSDTLTNPSDFQMAVLFYKVIGLEPPFDEWARSDQRVRNANEFDRGEISTRVQEELLLASRSVADIGYVEINTNSNFGEYDMTSQGFRLSAIDADRFWTWRFLNGRYKLTMDNGNIADLWKIPPEEARALVESMRRRKVDLKLRIKIVGAIPDTSGGGTLQGQIVDYDVLNDDGRKLGSMSF